jgi:phage shock protein PspC (stress-responsive transcriptional regulator)
MDSTTEQTTRLSKDSAGPSEEAPFEQATFDRAAFDQAAFDQAVPPSIAAAPEPAAGPKFRLRRSRTDRMVAGVCGGLAESLGVDATLLRIGLVTLTVLGFGTGVLVYAAIWMLAPETDEA